MREDLTRAFCSAIVLGCAVSTEARAQSDQATVPLWIEGNRPFVDIALRRADGSTRSARFLVDSGGGAFIMVERLARDVGLQWGESQREEGKEFALAATLPDASLGGVSLKLNARRVAVLLGAENILPPVAPGHAEGMFPGHVLARYHVIFDYPKAQFTLAQPGSLKPQGESLPMPVAKQSGFPRTEIEVAGVAYGFLIDTGASFTMVSEVLLKDWGNAHPDWARHVGAFGDAKTLGGQTLETMFVPSGRWGPFPLQDFGVTSQKEGTFERYMSSMMKRPIVGSLAGNVLKQFRVELDYKNETLYLSAP